MKSRSVLAIVMSLVLGITQVPVFDATTETVGEAATTPKLSATKLTVRVGKKKLLKVQNTSKKATFSISSGSTRIKFVSKKARQVYVKGVKTGSAKVKAKIKLSSKKTKTLTCKVTVKMAIWECPTCGQKNDTNYCSNCGTAKPLTTTATATPVPTVTPTPTVAPVGADAIASGKMLWMQLNDGYYVGLQMYANSAATDFYNRVVNSPDSMTFSMMPMNGNERVGYLSSPMALYPSASREMSVGDVYLYDQYTLKIAVSDHTVSAYPTRIAKVYDAVYKSSVTDAVSHDKESRTSVRFMLNFVTG